MQNYLETKQISCRTYGFFRGKQCKVLSGKPLYNMCMSALTE